MKKDRVEQAPSKEKNHQGNPLQNRPFTIQMPSSNIVVSNGKFFRYCKIFLRPLSRPFTMFLLDIHCPQNAPIPYIVYQPLGLLYVGVLVMGR
jgi:hypothetical protein